MVGCIEINLRELRDCYLLRSAVEMPGCLKKSNKDDEQCKNGVHNMQSAASLRFYFFGIIGILLVPCHLSPEYTSHPGLVLGGAGQPCTRQTKFTR
jgi:hypothetical protein